MARIKVFAVECEVKNLIWTAPEEDVQEMLEVITEANGDTLNHPHCAMPDNAAAFLMQQQLGAEILELDPPPPYQPGPQHIKH